jgi:hypothetical protein
VRASLVVAAFAAAFAGPLPAADVVPGERERIRADIAAAEAAFAVAQRECQDRFAVTACVNEARRERNEKLHRLRRQEAELDAAARRERAAQRAAAIGAKTQAAEPREASEAPRPPAPRMRVVARPAASAAAAASRPAAADSAQRRADEERSRAAHAERQREIQAHREAAEARAVQREREGRKAAPLPVPASAPR